MRSAVRLAPGWRRCAPRRSRRPSSPCGADQRERGPACGSCRWRARCGASRPWPTRRPCAPGLARRSGSGGGGHRRITLGKRFGGIIATHRGAPRRRPHSRDDHVPRSRRWLAAVCAGQPAGRQPPPLHAQNNLPRSATPPPGFRRGHRAPRRRADHARDPPRPGVPRRPAAARIRAGVWSPLVGESRREGHITPTSIGRASPGRPSWCATAASTPSRCRAACRRAPGLIAITASRDELASVLAHELSHVTQRHIARGIANSKRQSILGLAAC